MYEVKHIAVKKYMTEKATNDFDFMLKYNKNEPMPLREMAGFVLKESKSGKMVYMRCRGEIFSEVTETCMCCGKEITNDVSRYFGLGPVCGHHNYRNPLGSKKELKDAVNSYRENYLHKIIWEGWIPKSAIIFEKAI